MSRDPVPLPAAAKAAGLDDVAGGAKAPLRRHRPLGRARLTRAAAPYGLIAPAVLVILAVLGYPIYYLVRLSFQQYGLFELVAHKGKWIGLDNFSTILGDGQFWHVVLRTVIFTAVNVGLTLVLGTLIALLLKELGKTMRTAITAALVLAWSMPVVVAAQLWLWMTNYENGVLNYLFTKLHLGNFIQYDWFANTLVGFAVITSLIVWGAIPFVAVTVYAGLTQVPGELLEAAQIDGSGAFRRFRDITFPILKPIFVILASLSIIWDFQVFTQPFLLRLQRPDPDYWLMSVYAYEKAFGVTEYGLGSAIAVVMLVLMMGVTFFYVRQMVRIGEVT
jgi:N,N'-diacetylchitobiose transport system permease protein